MLRERYTRLLWLLLFTMFMWAGTAGAVVIDKDTVWSGDILVEDKVIVDEGATLLVLPGSNVAFRPMPAEAQKGGGRLIVFGRLIAQGTEASPILFTSAASSPKSGDWEGLRFEQSAQHFSRIDHCIIEFARGGINGRSSYLQVEKTHFKDNQFGVIARNGLAGVLFDCLITGNLVGIKFEQNDHLKIVNGRIENNQNGGVIYSNSSPIIQYSTVKNNGKYGIACLRGSSPLIENNLISKNSVGIHAEMMSSPSIMHNEIQQNETAIHMERLCFAVIENNHISQNQTGIYCNLGAYPHIHRNNIVENRGLAVDLGPFMSIVVARNPPFDARAEMNLTAPNKSQSVPVVADSVSPHYPKEGLVDAYGNWWGTGSLEGLHSKQPNKELFEDGYDQTTVFYRDQTYPRDRIGYAGWAEKEFAEAGRQRMEFSGVRGRVLRDGQPQAGFRVFVYRKSEDSFDAEGLAFSAPTGVDGAYVLSLKPGRYILVVRNTMPLGMFKSLSSQRDQEVTSERPVSVGQQGYTDYNFSL